MALNETASANDIGAMVSMDPGLTAKLLKAVNSSSYGLRSEVSSVSHAISIIGRQSLRSLVLGISVFDTMKSGGGQSAAGTQETLWKHAVATAAAAQLIAESVGKVNSEEAYIAGLMHDIGKVTFNMLRPADYQLAIADAAENGRTDEFASEVRHCGIDHSELGGLLAARWALPSGIRASIQYHHDPAAGANEPTPIRRIVAITRAADIMAFRCGYPSIEGQRPPDLDKVTQDLLARVEDTTAVERVKSEVRKCAEVFRYGESVDPAIWQQRLYSANAELSKAFAQVAETQRVQQKSTELIIQTQKFLGERDLIALVLKEAVDKLGFDRAYFLQITDDQKSVVIQYFVSGDGRGTELLGKATSLVDPSIFSKPSPMALVRGQDATSNAILDMLNVKSAVITPIEHDRKIRCLFGTDRGAKSAAGDAAMVDMMIHQLFAPSFSLLLVNDRLFKRAQYLSITDVLTGIANRRHLLETFEQIADKAQATKLNFCVAMFDIDHFKKFNDECGHQAGDQVLHGVAQAIQQNCRSYDVVGRYGGEEFCVILPSTSLTVAQGIAERVRNAVEQFGKENATKVAGRVVTVSGGLAAFTPGEKHQSLLGRADAALYRAKQGGRNRVELCQEK